MESLLCQRCGSLMKISKSFVICRCGYKDKIKGEIVLKTAPKAKQELKGNGIAKSGNVLAISQHTCKKCGYDKAQIIELGCYYSDEDEVIRYKCGRCGFVEQAPGKVV